MEKKTTQKNPTPRQRKAAKALVLNLEKEKPLPVGEVLKSVGYGVGLQNQPNRVIESEGFQQILAKYLPEDSLAERHVELLNAVSLEKINFNPKDTDEDIEEVVASMEGYKLIKIIDVKSSSNEKETLYKYAYVRAPDNMIREKALDKAYKLRGRYGAENPDDKPKTNNTYNFIFSSEVREDVKAIESRIKQQLMQKHESN